MKLILFTIIVLSISGCSIFQPSGTAEYSLEPFQSSNGKYICCRVSVLNTKDYEGINFKMVKHPDGSFSVELDEIGVSASDPSKVNAENTGKLLDAIQSIVPPN